jgi:hypothetical protein
MGCCGSKAASRVETSDGLLPPSPAQNGPPAQLPERPPAQLPERPLAEPPAYVDAKQIALAASKVSLESDPRWDRASFEAYTRRYAAFVTVGYLRQLLSGEESLPRADSFLPSVIPEAHLLRGPPPHESVAGQQLFSVLSPSFDQDAPNLHSEVAAVLAALDANLRLGTSDTDLVFWPRFSIDPSSPHAREGLWRMYTYYRVQLVILPALHGCARSVFERLETMAFIALSTFCQRLVNASDPHVASRVQLDDLLDLPTTLLRCQRAGDSPLELDRISCLLDRVIRALRPISEDSVGFQVLCMEAQLAWLPAPYVRELATRAGPFPRRQVRRNAVATR